MSSNEWILDSSALFHITFDEKVFQDLRLRETNRPELPRDESDELPILGSGRVRTEQLDIPDVLYVPGAPCNLISISRLARDHGLETFVDSSKFSVMNPTTGQKVGWGNCHGHHRYIVDHLVIRHKDAAGGSSYTGAGGDEDNQWILDSSSPVHFTFNLRLLRGLVTYSLQKIADALPPVGSDDRAWPAEGTAGGDLQAHDLGRHVGSQYLHILGHGSVQTESFGVPYVRYIQGEARNVISVDQLARVHGLKMVFEPTRCYVKDSKGHNVGMARLRNGVYVLDYLLIGQEEQQDEAVAFLPPQGTDAGLELEGPTTVPSQALIAATGKLELEGDEAERDRFGQSRCGWRPGEDGAPRALAIRAGAQAYYACATAHSAQHTSTSAYILDSAATHHMTGHEDLIEASTYKGRDSTGFPAVIVQDVNVANGISIPIRGIGNIVTDQIELRDVLHVGGMEANLISVSQLVDQLQKQVVEHLWDDAKDNPSPYEPNQLVRGNWIYWVAYPLQEQGVPLLLVNELARHMEDLNIQSDKIAGLGEMIQGLRNEPVLLANFTRCVQNMGVPMPLVNELFQELKTDEIKDRWNRINNLARRICKAETQVGLNDFSVTVGNLKVGCGVKNANLYHLSQLRPCPPVRLSLSACGMWVLKKTC